MPVSMSVSLNASFTPHRPLTKRVSEYSIVKMVERSSPTASTHRAGTRYGDDRRREERAARFHRDDDDDDDDVGDNSDDGSDTER